MDRYNNDLNSGLDNTAQTPSYIDLGHSKSNQNGDQIYKNKYKIVKTNRDQNQLGLCLKREKFVEDFIAKLKAKNQVQARDEIEEEELRRYLSEESAFSALSIGLPADQIEQAYREKLKQTGTSFASAKELIEAVLQLEKRKQEPKKEEEIEMLKKEKTCKICLEAQIDVVLVPCGHLVTCIQCTKQISICPLCRAKIQSSMKTFFS